MCAIVGCTPLILAASAGHVVTVTVLLEHGANIEAVSDRTKDTALSLACSGGRQEVCGGGWVWVCVYACGCGCGCVDGVSVCVVCVLVCMHSCVCVWVCVCVCMYVRMYFTMCIIGITGFVMSHDVM